MLQIFAMKIIFFGFNIVFYGTAQLIFRPYDKARQVTALREREFLSFPCGLVVL